LTEWSLDGVIQKTWSLDSLGNNLSAGTYNAANEATPTQGSSGYDAAGNMTTLQSGKTAIYDAWNRLVEVDDGETVVERHEYDGTNRRIQIYSDFDGSVPNVVQDDYHSSQQVIESDVATDGSRNGGHQTIWSPRYIDAPILRDTLNVAGTGIVTAERGFYLADANYNVTGLAKYDSEAGKWQMAERNSYTPYGVVTYRSTDWTVAVSSANTNTTLYTGRTLDLLTGLHYYRARYYDAELERFINRDPIAADINLYRYCVNEPLIATDPYGEQSAGGHHPYPLHLGGCMSQNLIWLNDAEHQAVHGYLRSLGYGYGDSGRASWEKLSLKKQAAVIRKSLEAAKIDKARIDQAMKTAMKGCNPGVKTPRLGKCGKVIKCIPFIGVVVSICCSDDAEGAVVETIHPINQIFGGCSTMGDAEYHPSGDVPWWVEPPTNKDKPE
jgi:RHS repeat-associated protein